MNIHDATLLTANRTPECVPLSKVLHKGYVKFVMSDYNQWRYYSFREPVTVLE